MDEQDFLLRDYKLKIRYLSDHFQRMWTRFNFFITIESALIGGKIIYGGGELNWQLALLGIVLSFIWYVFGAQDRYLVSVYRKQVEDAGQKVATTLWPQNSTRRVYNHVGEVGKVALEAQQGDAKQSFLGKVVERLSEWRVELLSTTRLAALFPFLISLIWLGALTRLVWKIYAGAC